LAFFSILGCLVATVMSNRWGLARPLFVSLIAMTIVVGMLASGIGNTKIMISVFAFNLLWIFIDVYQMATDANIDHFWQLRLAHAWRPGTGADRWAKYCSLYY
jgi:hypothetical protein